MRSILSTQILRSIGLIGLLVSLPAAAEKSEYPTGAPDAACEAGEGPMGRYDTHNLPAEYKEFAPFIPADERLLQITCVTLPDRRGMRYLLATRAKPKVGSLSIIARDIDKSLHLEAINSTVISIGSDNGLRNGGNFESIWTTGPGLFSINNFYGEIERDVTEYQFLFRYSTMSNVWLLDSVVTTRHGHEGERVDETTQVRTEKDFGRVTFSQFDGRHFGIRATTDPSDVALTDDRDI